MRTIKAVPAVLGCALAVLLAGCGSGGEGGAPAGTLHVTGVDALGAAVDFRVRPLRGNPQVTLSAYDNDPVSGWSVQGPDEQLLAFSTAGSPISYALLTMRHAGQPALLQCIVGCSLDVALDAGRRRLTLGFPDAYRFSTGATGDATGLVRVTGALEFEYDPSWLVLQTMRFPETPVAAVIQVNGQPFVVSQVRGHGGLRSGVAFKAADGSSFSCSLSAEGDVLRISYWDAAAERSYGADMAAADLGRSDGHYQLVVNDLPLVAGDAQLVVSLDLALPDVDGVLVVTGAGDLVALQPRAYSLSTTNNLRRYEFGMVDQDGGSVTLRVSEQSGMLGPVELWRAGELAHGCGMEVQPTCAGISLSDGGNTVSLSAVSLSNGVTLHGDLTHPGVIVGAAPAP